MARKHMKKADIAKMLRLSAKGLGAADISCYMSFSTDAIRRQLQKRGLPTVSKEGVKRVKEAKRADNPTPERVTKSKAWLATRHAIHMHKAKLLEVRPL